MLIKAVSEVKKIIAPRTRVFAFLSDFEKIAEFFDGKSNNIPEAEKQKISDQISDFYATTDKCTFNINNYGKTGLEIIEREPENTIKYTSISGSPMPVTIWVQLKEVSEYDTRLRLTVHAKVSMMMKMMLKGKIEKGVDKIADAFTKIPY